MKVIRKMKTHSFVLTIIIFTTMMMSGCASWTYDGQSYPSSSTALEAARKDVQRKIMVVTPIDIPVAKTALIYVPSVKWSRNGVKVNGQASEEQITYIASVLYYGWHGMAEALRKRKLFENVDIKEFSQLDPLASRDYEYLIWLRLQDPDSAEWVITPANDTSTPSVIYTSPVLTGGDRINSFVNEIEEYVKAHPSKKTS